MFTKSGRVKKPEWIEACSIERVMKLYHEGKLPTNIEKWLLVVPAKHLLRGCYGCSNFRVALHLLVEATHDYWREKYWYIRFKLGLDQDVSDGLNREVANELDRSIGSEGH